jgi:hypothetical protein
MKERYRTLWAIAYWHTYCILTYILLIDIHIAYWHTYCLLTYILHIDIHIAYWHTYCILTYILHIDTHIAYWHTYCILTHILPTTTTDFISQLSSSHHWHVQQFKTQSIRMQIQLVKNCGQLVRMTEFHLAKPKLYWYKY